MVMRKTPVFCYHLFKDVVLIAKASHVFVYFWRLFFISTTSNHFSYPVSSRSPPYDHISYSDHCDSIIIKILPALKSYACLVSDGVLLPQIPLNTFCNSNQKALSVSCYIGTTSIRVLPHAYDLYRARSHHHSRQQLNESYIYASPTTDCFLQSSIHLGLIYFAWDVIVPFGGLLLAGNMALSGLLASVYHLARIEYGIDQLEGQKFGGRFILPQKLRSLSEYQVPTVTEV
ncbi:hypothetical protein ACFX1T_007600 [Malus domestica]